MSQQSVGDERSLPSSASVWVVSVGGMGKSHNWLELKRDEHQSAADHGRRFGNYAKHLIPEKGNLLLVFHALGEGLCNDTEQLRVRLCAGGPGNEVLLISEQLWLL